MRIFKPVLILLICIGWVVLLNRPMGSVPAIGKRSDDHFNTDKGKNYRQTIFQQPEHVDKVGQQEIQCP